MCLEIFMSTKWWWAPEVESSHHNDILTQAKLSALGLHKFENGFLSYIRISLICGLLYDMVAWPREKMLNVVGQGKSN